MEKIVWLEARYFNVVYKTEDFARTWDPSNVLTYE